MKEAFVLSKNTDTKDDIACKLYAKENGFEIVTVSHVHTEQEKGEAIQKAIRMATCGDVDTLLIFDMSFVSRHFECAMERLKQLDNSGISVITCTGGQVNPNNEMFRVFATVASVELPCGEEEDTE